MHKYLEKRLNYSQYGFKLAETPMQFRGFLCTCAGTSHLHGSWWVHTLCGIKDYRYHAFQNTEFSYFLTIDTKQYELPNYLLKIGGHRPLKNRYDIICNDVIFH